MTNKKRQHEFYLDRDMQASCKVSFMFLAQMPPSIRANVKSRKLKHCVNGFLEACDGLQTGNNSGWSY